VLYQKYITIPDHTWTVKDTVSFNVPVSAEDTAAVYDVSINVRNSDNYDFSNLYLFIDVTNPAHQTERDTFEYPLATDAGKWLGRGLGDIWDNKCHFKLNKHLSKGEYKFTFQQAMRVDKLPGIMDVGLTIEKSPSVRTKTN